MNNNDTNTNLLLQYLDNELDDATKATVEQRLAREAELKEQLSQLQLAREAVRLYGLKQQVKQIGLQFRTSESTQVIPKASRIRYIGKWSLRVAAIFILMIAGI